MRVLILQTSQKSCSIKLGYKLRRVLGLVKCYISINICSHCSERVMTCRIERSVLFCLQCVCSIASDSLQPDGYSPLCPSVLGTLQARLHWSGLPFPTPGDLPDPGIKLASLALSGKFFTTEPPEKTSVYHDLLSTQTSLHCFWRCTVQR